MMNLLKKNYVKYGLILTALLLPCLFYLEISGHNQSFNDKSPVFMIYQFIAPLVVWYFGLKSYKKMHKGMMTFKQGVAEGFRMSLVFAITSPIIFTSYYLFINPEILISVKAAYGMPDATNALIITVDMTAQVIAAIIGGTIYAAIASLILRTRKTK